MAHWDPIFLGLFLVLFAAVAAFANACPQGDRRWWTLFSLLALLVIAAMVSGEGWPRQLLLDAAAFTGVALVWSRGTPEAARAARTYLLLLVVSLACLTGGELLIHEQPLPRLAVALLVVGFGVKLALVPFYCWLPAVAGAAAPMTTVLIVSVVDVAAFTELAHLGRTTPALFADFRGLWVTLALLSMLTGAILALAQRDLRRMLAFSTIDDMGYLILGLAAGPAIGVTGALAGACGHALSKMLLFGAAGIAEEQTGKPLTLETRGLAARCPVAAAAFIVGALGVIGVPPTFGFAGRWRLYLVGAAYGGGWLIAAMVLATGIALLYYARAIHRVWLGADAEADPLPIPGLARIVLAVVMIAMVLLGLVPGAITTHLR
jgi:multicomponent Na+:H+ antiporter subunit D